MKIQYICNLKIFRYRCHDYILKKYYGDYMIPIHEKNNHEDRIILNPYKSYIEVLDELKNDI